LVKWFARRCKVSNLVSHAANHLLIFNIDKTGWKEGDVMEMTNDVFDKNIGIAYWPLHKDWEIIKMEIKEFKEIHI